MLSRLAYLLLCRSFQLLVLLVRGDATKDLEILVLRHQLTVLRRQVARPRLEPADRALLSAVSRVLPRARWSCFLVKPEMLLRWHRRLVAGAWTYPHRQTGRPPLDQEVQQLIVRLARENPRWGYQRIEASSNGLACALPSVQPRWQGPAEPTRSTRSPGRGCQSSTRWSCTPWSSPAPTGQAGPAGPPCDRLTQAVSAHKSCVRHLARQLVPTMPNGPTPDWRRSTCMTVSRRPGQEGGSPGGSDRSRRRSRCGPTVYLGSRTETRPASKTPNRVTAEPVSSAAPDSAETARFRRPTSAAAAPPAARIRPARIGAPDLPDR
jgi:hypothetical protein